MRLGSFVADRPRRVTKPQASVEMSAPGRSQDVEARARCQGRQEESKAHGTALAALGGGCRYARQTRRCAHRLACHRGRIRRSVPCSLEPGEPQKGSRVLEQGLRDAPMDYTPGAHDSDGRRLLTALRSGDDNALAQLLERHAPACTASASRCAASRGRKGRVQDTLLAVHAAARVRAGRPVTWLFTIARSFCIKNGAGAWALPASSFPSKRTTRGGRHRSRPRTKPLAIARSRGAGCRDRRLERCTASADFTDVEGLTAQEVRASSASPSTR